MPPETPSTPTTRAGHLYAPGDYAGATEAARQLVLDAGARAAMGAAARAHVEKLGWMAAVRRIRDTQYARAIRTFRAHKRCAPPGTLNKTLSNTSRSWAGWPRCAASATRSTRAPSAPSACTSGARPQEP